MKNSIPMGSLSGIYEKNIGLQTTSIDTSGMDGLGISHSSMFGGGFGGIDGEKPRKIESTSTYLKNIERKYANQSNFRNVNMNQSHQSQDFPIGQNIPIEEEDGIVHQRFTVKNTKDDVPQVFKNYDQQRSDFRQSQRNQPLPQDSPPRNFKPISGHLQHKNEHTNFGSKRKQNPNNNQNYNNEIKFNSQRNHNQQQQNKYNSSNVPPQITYNQNNNNQQNHGQNNNINVGYSNLGNQNQNQNNNNMQSNRNTNKKESKLSYNYNTVNISNSNSNQFQKTPVNQRQQSQQQQQQQQQGGDNSFLNAQYQYQQNNQSYNNGTGNQLPVNNSFLHNKSNLSYQSNNVNVNVNNSTVNEEQRKKKFWTLCATFIAHLPEDKYMQAPSIQALYTTANQEGIDQDQWEQFLNSYFNL